MCFDLDSRPPIAPIAGGSLDHGSIVLTASDGNRFLAFRARPAHPSGAAIVILPDVRGLHPYYEELALRFAETGVDALAIDYFGRTAGVDAARDDAFEFMPHVQHTTIAGLTADLRAGAVELRNGDAGPPSALFTVGFCYGGRLAFGTPTLGLGLAGAIGFYGSPVGAHASGTPIPTEVAAAMECPVLGIFGGADASIPPADIATFETALASASVDHQLITYPGAPHSFFDRKAADFGTESNAAWEASLAFIREHTDRE